VIEGVVFDLDGVLLDSEQVWDAAREQLVRERGGRWHERAQRDMMGMSSPEWSRYMHDKLDVPDPPEEISAEVRSSPVPARQSSGSPNAGRSHSRRRPTAS
jgi:beta-phosphoglucomutase-like phosphatase (HAD superfamily)